MSRTGGMLVSFFLFGIMRLLMRRIVGALSNRIDFDVMFPCPFHSPFIDSRLGQGGKFQMLRRTVFAKSRATYRCYSRGN
mmetsp:Transcript_36317/g.79437  ORF Transcript_36317/g.79437 Transcript_36317/m.79437 type:complete len:80 (+) Transcript_36317:1-240(+)